MVSSNEPVYREERALRRRSPSRGGFSGFSSLTVTVRPRVLRRRPIFRDELSEVSFNIDEDDVGRSGAMISFVGFVSSVVAAFPLPLLRRSVTPIASSGGRFLVLRRTMGEDISSVLIIFPTGGFLDLRRCFGVDDSVVVTTELSLGLSSVAGVDERPG